MGGKPNLRSRGVTRAPALVTPCLDHVAAVGETALGMGPRLRVSNGAAISARCPGDYETQGKGYDAGEDTLHGDHPLPAHGRLHSTTRYVFV